MNLKERKQHLKDGISVVIYLPILAFSVIIFQCFTPFFNGLIISKLYEPYFDDYY